MSRSSYSTHVTTCNYITAMECKIIIDMPIKGQFNYHRIGSDLPLDKKYDLEVDFAYNKI